MISEDEVMTQFLVESVRLKLLTDFHYPMHLVSNLLYTVADYRPSTVILKEVLPLKVNTFES
jgi:hypothetical protein